MPVSDPYWQSKPRRIFWGAFLCLLLFCNPAFFNVLEGLRFANIGHGWNAFLLPLQYLVRNGFAIGICIVPILGLVLLFKSVARNSHTRRLGGICFALMVSNVLVGFGYISSTRAFKEQGDRYLKLAQTSRWTDKTFSSFGFRRLANDAFKSDPLASCAHLQWEIQREGQRVNLVLLDKDTGEFIVSRQAFIKGAEMGPWFIGGGILGALGERVDVNADDNLN